MSTEIPIAQAVTGTTTLVVDNSNIEQAIADKAAKELTENGKKKQDEYFALQRKLEKEKHDTEVQLMKKKAEQEMEQQRIRFAYLHPEADEVRRRHRLEDVRIAEEKKNHENTRQIETKLKLHDKNLRDWKENVRFVGFALMGMGSGLYFYSLL